MHFPHFDHFHKIEIKSEKQDYRRLFPPFTSLGG